MICFRNSFRLSLLLLLVFLAGCGKRDSGSLVLLRVTVDPAEVEAWKAYDGHFFRNFRIDVPGARGDHEVGIICDDATWQTLWKQREFVSWYCGPVQPYQKVPFLGTRGLECDQVSNCHYLGRLQWVDCPDGKSKPDWLKPQVSFHLPGEVRSKFEIVVLTSRSQRGLASLQVPAGGYQPPAGPGSGVENGDHR